MSDDLTAASDEARWAGRQGWNVRCHRCGTFGATWHRGDRPNWYADVALCEVHADELEAEYSRHTEALRLLREKRFEQPNPPIRMPSMAEDRRRRAAALTVERDLNR